MAELIIENKASLYEPIKIVIDGVEYFVRSFDKKGIAELHEYDGKLSGNPAVLYERLEFILAQKPGTFSHLISEVVTEVSNFVIAKLYSRKKVTAPGNKESKK